MADITIPKGFIPWAGGECPVPGDMMIRVKTAMIQLADPVRADTVSWSLAIGNHIIAYRPDPNYVAPIDWQARAEKAEAEIAAVKEALDNAIGELARQREINAALMGDDENKPRYTTKRLRMEIERATETHVAELATLRAKAEKLAAAANSLYSSRFSTWKSRNGRDVGVQDASGEKCWIVPDDEFGWLRAALAEWEGKP